MFILNDIVVEKAFLVMTTKQKPKVKDWSMELPTNENVPYNNKGNNQLNANTNWETYMMWIHK